MDLELLITELDQTTIQLDKINFLATRIMSIASEKTKHAKNALEYDFESQEIFKCSTILLDYVEMADTAEYYGAAEPPVRCGESHLSGLTEPPHFVY